MSENINGLYKDEDGQLWVVVHLKDEDLLECGEDLSYQYKLPDYTIISRNSEFLNIKCTKEMIKINDVAYQCIEYPYCVDKTKLKDAIVESLGVPLGLIIVLLVIMGICFYIF